LPRDLLVAKPASDGRGDLALAIRQAVTGRIDRGAGLA